MATATKPKKLVDRESKTKLDSLAKMPSLESLLVNVLNGIQNDIREQKTETKNDIRELRTEIKNDCRELNERIDSNFKWTLGIMATLIAFVFTAMFFLHSDLKSDLAEFEINLKSDMAKVETNLKSDIKQNRKSINQINQKLDRLLSK